MRDAGEVQFAEVMMMNDGRSKGCGIVEFADEEGAQNAIDTLNDTELCGRQIFVREDREQKVSGGGHHGQHGHGGQHGGGWNRVGGGAGGGGGRYNNQLGNVNVYVGNLAYETTWQELKDHMRRVGNIDKVSTYTFVKTIICQSSCYWALISLTFTSTFSLPGRHSPRQRRSIQRLRNRHLPKPQRSPTCHS